MIVNGFPRGVKIYTDQVSGLAVSAVANTPGSLTISWTQPSSKLYKGVTLVYKTGSYPTSPTDGTVVYVAKGTVTKTITGLTGGTSYYVRAFAKATNTSGSKVYYNTTTAGAQAGRATIANPVTNFAASTVGNDPTRLSLSWSAPAGLYDGVMVRYKTGGHPTSNTDGTLYYYGTNTSGTIGGLVGGTQYFFRVFVYNSENAVNSNTSQQSASYTAPSPITNLAVAKTSSTSLTASWTAPAGLYKSVMVCYKTGGYPASAVDGTLLYQGTGASAVATGLASGTTYYFRAFVFNAVDVANYVSSQQASNTTKIPAGRVVFTSSQTWTVPAGVYAVDAFKVGGGGSGFFGASSWSYVGGGGGGGYTKTTSGIAVTPGQQVAVVVGAGGAAVNVNSQSYGKPGGASSFGSYSAAGGNGAGDSGAPTAYQATKGGNGGSGGGSNFAAGGSNGSNGNISNWDYAAATGQGTTTKEFGTGTLYAGGGGGGNYLAGAPAGGAGGGGNGGESYGNGNPGTPNTGGGGGGCAFSTSGAGGSGVVVVRWAEQ